MVTPRIFISMGTPYTTQQQQFRDELEAFLRDSCNADPRIIGKNEYPAGNPLSKIKDVMAKCHGVVIVAYERKIIITGVERRGSTDNQRKIENKKYTTIWNHIESALAFALNIPIYIICENDLSEEGLIESKVDWYVQHLEIKSGEFLKHNVSASLRNWVDTRVRPLSKKPRFITSLTGKLKISEMTIEEISIILAAIGSIFGAGVATALWFSKFIH